MDQVILKRQLQFYVQGKVGCAFAALAATDPERYGWYHHEVSPSSENIDRTIEAAICDPDTSTCSLLFPEVDSTTKLLALTRDLQRCRTVFLDQETVYEKARCLGFRVRVEGLISWASGFGPFEFFPATRQTPIAELVFRAKPRPNYAWVFKPAPEGVIHLADMDMLGLAEATLRTLWGVSFEKTAAILGHPPDPRSAAKTTFSIPIGLGS